MLGRAILEDYEVPTTPMGTDQSEEHLMRVLVPILGDQQREIAAPNIDRPVEQPLGVRAADRHPNLLADGTIAAIQVSRLCDVRFGQHQYHRVRRALQSAFRLPFAYRQ